MPSSRSAARRDPGANPAPPWRARAEEIARRLVRCQASRSFGLDIQRVFSWLPPDRPAGAGLFRLVEAFPRTPDRPGRLALIREHVPWLDGALRAAVAMPAVAAATALVGRQFVYAEDIDTACRRAARALRARKSARFSFDMLGEGARTAAAAQDALKRYVEAIRVAGQSASAAHASRVAVSIKLSSLHPRVDAAGFYGARAELLERLRQLCTMAAGTGVPLTIDAEESERVEMQLDLFTALARMPELLRWGGLGLAVQAYQKHAMEAVDAVTRVATGRLAAGGAGITVRLVKGAYWDAEVKRAQEIGLEDYPVFTRKADTDAAYVRCAARLLESLDAIYPQFATHNPVTAACVLAMAEAQCGPGEPDRFEMQRLHGMGASLEAAVAQCFPGVGMRVYAPVGRQRELLAYLVRRLLENSASTSYVRQAARCPDSQSLVAAGFAFLDGDPLPRPGLPPPTEIHMPERRSAAGLDLGVPSTLASLAEQVARARRSWEAAPLCNGLALPGPSRPAFSPAHPEVAIGTVREATLEHVHKALGAANDARLRWSATDVEQRARLLERLADLLEADTPQLLSLCVWEAGKTLADALADVREAVDFCRYYAAQARASFMPRELKSPAGERNVLSLHGRGVFACISPWNFPIAIFTGQVAAALVAGNTVVAKPAEQAPLAAYRIVQLALEAGIPPEVLHLLPGEGEVVGKALTEDARTAGVAFTGSNEAARAIQRALAGRDGCIAPFIAETGGLNAMIVDSTALPEQVVDAVVASAFRSAGQRCSSLRMLYLQDEIAPAVLEMLRGAMSALRVGDPADPATDVGPLIDRHARDALLRYVAELKRTRPLVGEAVAPAGAGWYLAPVAFEVGSIRDLPGERFGPILHVARFPIGELEQVIADVNAVGFGLTMGVHTRVAGRAEQIRASAAVGNLYVNRNMIGAVVGVQPFGGEGLSGTGPKAGGPHYLSRFATERVFTVNTAAAGGDLQLLTGAGL